MQAHATKSSAEHKTASAPAARQSPSNSRMTAQPGLLAAAGPLFTLGLPLQAKLTSNKPGDSSEREADRVADHVMRLPDTAVQRCACGGVAGPDGECAACKARRQAAPAFTLGLPLQTKLTVNEPGDAYEQEADRVAEQVMRVPEPAPSLLQRQEMYDEEEQVVQTKPIITSFVLRTTAPAAEDTEEKVQMKSRGANSDAAGPPVADQIGNLRGRGSAMPAPTRAFAESRLGYDFSRVRFHTDHRAGQTARALQARAYTLGHDVVFAPGEYSPATRHGQELIIHELTHVVQQSRAPPLHSPTPSYIQRKCAACSSGASLCPDCAKEEQIQRKCAACSSGASLCPDCAEEEQVQRKTDEATSAPVAGQIETADDDDDAIESTLERKAGSGSRLPPATRAHMEARFGAPFDGVRVHVGTEAAALTDTLAAEAFAYGRDIYFAPGAYRPGTAAGDHLLAHELTHVVQQSVGGFAVQRNGKPSKKKGIVSAFKRLVTGNIAGGEIHNRVQEQLRAGKNDDLVTEAPIPGNTATGSGTYDHCLLGWADFYKSEPARQVTGIFYDCARDEPGFGAFPKDYKGEAIKHHRTRSGSKFTRTPTLKKGVISGTFPTRIWVGDLKPATRSSIRSGTKQLNKYKTGLAGFAKEATKQSVDVDILKVNQINLPEPLDYRKFEDQRTKKAGGLFYPDRNGHRIWIHPYSNGLWVYFDLARNVSEKGFKERLEQLQARLKELRAMIPRKKKKAQRHPAKTGRRPAKARRQTPAQQSVAKDKQKRPTATPTRHAIRSAVHPAGHIVQRAPKDNQALKEWEAKRKIWAGDADTFLEEESDVIAKMEIDDLLGISSGGSLAAYARPVSRVRLWSSKLGALFGKIGYYLGEGWEKLEKFLGKLRDKFENLKKKIPKSDDVKGGGWKRKALSLIVKGIKFGFTKLADFTFSLFNRCITAIVDRAIDSFWEKIEDETGFGELKEDFEKQIADLLKPFEEAAEQIRDAAEKFEEKFGGLEEEINKFRTFVTTSAEVLAFVGKLEWPIRAIFQAISCGSPPGWGCLWGIIGQVSMSFILSVVMKFCPFHNLMNRMACKLLRSELGRWYRGLLQDAINLVGLNDWAKQAGPACDFTGDFPCDLKPEKGCIDLPNFGGGGSGESEKTPEPPPQEAKKPEPPPPGPEPKKPEAGKEEGTNEGSPGGKQPGEGSQPAPGEGSKAGKGAQASGEIRQRIEAQAQKEKGRIVPCYEMSANQPAEWSDVADFLRVVSRAGISGDVLRALHYANCNADSGRYSLTRMMIGLKSPPKGVNAAVRPPAGCANCTNTPPSGGPPPPGKQKPPPGGGKGQGGQGQQGSSSGGQDQQAAGGEQQQAGPAGEKSEKADEAKDKKKPPPGQPPPGEPPSGQSPQSEGKQPEAEKEKLDWTEEDQAWLEKQLGQPDEAKEESKSERLDRLETIQGVLQEWQERARRRGDDETARELEDEVNKVKEQIREEQQAPPLQPKRSDGSHGSDAGGQAAPPIVHSVLSKPGQPLDAATRAFMEPRLGYDLGGVRMHNGLEAATSAQAVRARAYTVGRDVVFGAGQYAPGTADGRRLLAHELVHVVQQQTNALTRLARSPDGRADDLVKGSDCQIHFVQGTTEFTDPREFDDCLKTIRAYLKGSSARKVTLHGYASTEGPENFNKELSQKRAHIVHLLLGQGGIDRGRIETHGHGPDSTYPTLKENRRVEVILEEQTALPDDKIEPFKPDLPAPELPQDTPGPKIPPGHTLPFCKPFPSKRDALREHIIAKTEMMLFTSKFGTDVQQLWLTYLETPKTGTKGTLPPRKVFGDQKSRVVKEFREDPETITQRQRIAKLIMERVKKDPKIMPAVGETTPFMPFRTVLTDKEILDLPMSFKDPFNRIPGLIAGGFGKNSSDAGDDVRNVDGQFRVTNQGGGTLRIQVQSIYDILDAVDFCPGAAGSLIAQLGVTIRLSMLEATPDIPTYDTPFEVVAGAADDIIEQI